MHSTPAYLIERSLWRAPNTINMEIVTLAAKAAIILERLKASPLYPVNAGNTQINPTTDGRYTAHVAYDEDGDGWEDAETFDNANAAMAWILSHDKASI